MQIHVVQPGQTLWTLSQRYRVPVQSIINQNAIANPSRLLVGQALVIPTPQGTYIVQPGNTLQAIAASFGTSVASLASRNGIAQTSALQTGQVLRVPARNQTAIEVNAYVTDFGPRGQQTVRDLGPTLTYLSPFSYHVTAAGALVPLNDAALLSAAHAQGVTPMLVISNWLGDMFNSDLAHTILNDPTVHQALIDNILTTMKTRGYRALNIDFEYVRPEDRQPYNAFLQTVVTRLHQEGFLVSTALAPKTSGSQTGLLYEAHDYPVHGALCDFVVLMTYEWGWIGGPPMAVSPINQITKVLDYAVSVMPSNKILIGVSVYGYDWKLPFVKGTLAKTLTPQGAVDLAAAHSVAIQYDSTSQAPNYQYTDSSGQRHQVWFEDARSFQAKLMVVRGYGLRGISYWAYPTDFPQVPAVLREHFQVRKL